MSPSASPPGRLLTPDVFFLGNTSPSPSLLLLETTMGSEGFWAGGFTTTRDVCASPLAAWGVTTLPLLPAVVFRLFPLDGSWLVAAFLISKAALPNIFASGCSARSIRNRVNQPASSMKKDEQKTKQATTQKHKQVHQQRTRNKKEKYLKGTTMHERRGWPSLNKTRHRFLLQEAPVLLEVRE